ncbi:apolipo protein O-domain-containing protein [Trametes punicea]|nr:apolipo protein O-domain-containing protein [Trametes punicea]
MLRVFATRGSVVAAAVAVGVHEKRDKLPIYPTPDPEIVLVETPSELEKKIGVARRAVIATYQDARDRVQSVVSRWIGVEQAVENRVKSLIAPDEPLTPGILYVGVATLTGSVLARNRLFWRLTLPPALFVFSLNHFLPKTTHNVSSYLGELEERHFPALAEKHEIAKQHSAMTWERLKESTRSGREAFSDGVVSLVGKVEEATGLKLRETLGWRGQVVKAAEAKTREVADAAKEVAAEAKTMIEEKAEKVEQAVAPKDPEPKRLV